MNPLMYKIIGAIGLILICIGMIVKRRLVRDDFSIFGGIALLIYSIYLDDLIFIILQTVYTIIVSIDYFRLIKKR